MINRNTVLVVGAGASKEANLPTGDALKKNIANLLNIQFDDFERKQRTGDPVLFKALRQLSEENGLNVDDLLLFGWRIRDAMPQAISIDNFVDAHSDNKMIEKCGKLAIARAILSAEKSSYLWFDKNKAKLDFSKLELTWYKYFFQLITENCQFESLSKRLRSISLIVFNYDRCVQHFLFHAFQNYYGVDAISASELVNQIEIYHPYGTVGYLPWQHAGNSIEFGADPNFHQLLDITNQIKTFTEGTDPKSSDITSIHKKISDSQILVFLGFAFHKQNLILLRPYSPPKSGNDIHCFATAKDISHSDCEIIKSKMCELRNTSFKTLEIRNDLSCAGLFKEYWMSLGLS